MSDATVCCVHIWISSINYPRAVFMQQKRRTNRLEIILSLCSLNFSNKNAWESLRLKIMKKKNKQWTSAFLRQIAKYFGHLVYSISEKKVFFNDKATLNKLLGEILLKAPCLYLLTNLINWLLSKIQKLSNLKWEAARCWTCMALCAVLML